ncbi:lamin tail domain-containing protein [Salinibacterium soli]|uniref:Lamin tail domain-containing protein n=1 Tax=Antiquaquibacter soli TaxID=3064523 RepID=A0ABT9BQL3_9MICO|nr:lamin tail domain-containing protein [Protaetiibacter sp. WY-16]MDO7883295.1 lamin tail domain-containing protein [Protaetiibacter sp. WY-16]
MIRLSRALVATATLSALLAVGIPVTAHAAEDPAEGAPRILINELANGGPRSDSDSFFELRNWGDEPVDLTGWQVFRCSAQGLRSNVGRTEGDLAGIVLQPGEIVTVSRVGMPGRLHITEAFALTGFGLYLEDPDDRLADAVGVYPNEPWMTESECTVGRNLPNRLDFAAGESWQRVSATGDLERDFVVAPATIDAPNRTAPSASAESPVVISEVAPFGPAGAEDEFVELENTGTEAVDVGGWQLYRCTASGRANPGSLELVVPDGTLLAAGERWVIGGDRFAGERDAALGHSLANVEFGVLLRTGSGALVDRVAVSAHDDSACQDGDGKLRAILDGVAGESYQRTADGEYLVAPRTPGTSNAVVAESVLDAHPTVATGVAISELATDPSTEGMPAGSVQRNFIELGNYGTTPVDLSNWTVRRCQADGTRAAELQFTVPEGTRVEPGGVFLAARSGTDAASIADVTYDESLNFLGTGLWIEDADGNRVDRVGVYATNEMDSSNVVGSPCTNGAALTVYLPDRMLGETFHRAQFTGSDADDYVAAPATPGVIDDLDWTDPTARVATVETAALAVPVRERAVAGDEPTAAATVVEAWGGVSAAPLTHRSAPGEEELDPGHPAPVSDEGWGLPYVRLVLDASALSSGDLVGWSGSTVDRGELQLSVWSPGGWRLIDSGPSGLLSGALADGDIVNGRVELLVQDGPRSTPTVTTERDGMLEDPTDYDFAITHITDTQYLTESYPEVYAQLASWVADNAESREIAFAVHTGDLIQNWVDPDQNETRARAEFERASAIQSILEDAGVASSVLPGNHDNKRGVTNDLFNEYFPPSRYESNDWYGGSIAPGDNSASCSTFDEAGARFLVLSLPYAYGEREIAWAEQVVAAHPDHNVIVATHEHVQPKTLEVGALRSTGSRWVSRGGELWERVIAPNRNVVMVLSGHFHGLGQIVTENAGGIPGHTVVEVLADYQEFRTHTGERATGFFRMLQFDLDGGAVAVDTRSVRLAEPYSADFDYHQFLPDNGQPSIISNSRPWNIVGAGLQGRYSAEDDEFTAWLAFQHPKLVATDAVLAG